MSILKKFSELNINTPGLVTVPANSNGDYATLRFGLQHYLTEIAKFKFNESDTLSGTKMGEKLRKLEKYLTAAEKQIGPENVKLMHAPMTKVLFENTSIEYLAETSKSWRDLIQDLRDFFQCPAVDETSLFYELLNIDSSKLSVKQALIKVYGIIQKAKADSILGILPNPVIIVPKIVGWFPPTSHAMLKERFDEVAAKTSWTDLEDDLRELMMETPPELKCHKSQTTSQRTPVVRPVTTVQTPLTTSGVTTAPRVLAMPKAKSAAIPTAVTATPISTGAPKAKAKAKAIGRLMKEEEGFVGEFRVDTGADDNVFGKDLIGFVKSLGPSKGTYSTPLSSSSTMAEACVADVCIADVNGIEHPMKIRGIMNPGNNLSVLSVKTASFQDGQGTFQLEKLHDATFPCHSRKGFPYAKVRFNGTTKRIDSFLAQLGFTALPKPSLEEVARAVHLKFACAGTDT